MGSALSLEPKNLSSLSLSPRIAIRFETGGGWACQEILPPDGRAFFRKNQRKPEFLQLVDNIDGECSFEMPPLSQAAFYRRNPPKEPHRISFRSARLPTGRREEISYQAGPNTTDAGWRQSGWPTSLLTVKRR
jgi:hypothetical protein